MTTFEDGVAALLLVSTVGAAAALLCRLSAMSRETTPASVRQSVSA